MLLKLLIFQDDDESILEEDINYECGTQTRDKFIRQPVRVYKLSESEFDLKLVEPGPVIAKPIIHKPEKYTQSPSLHRFSLARLQREPIKEISEVEQFCRSKRQKDASILAQPFTRTILSKLSSAHLRQLVSPFYKQLDLPYITGPSLTKIFKSNLEKESERFNNILTNSQNDCVQTDPKLLKDKIVFPKIDSPVVQYEMPKPRGPRAQKKSRKVDKIVARLSTPTHNTRIKSTQKKDTQKPITPNRLIEKVEEPSKIPECKHCRFKRIKFESKDPNYDELQEFLENIDPLID